MISGLVTYICIVTSDSLFPHAMSLVQGPLRATAHPLLNQPCQLQPTLCLSQRPSPSVTASVPLLPTAHPLLNQPCQLQLELEPCRRKTLETCSQLFTESGLTRDCVHVSESQFMRVCASVRSAHGRSMVAESASAWTRHGGGICVSMDEACSQLCTEFGLTRDCVHVRASH